MSLLQKQYIHSLQHGVVNVPGQRLTVWALVTVAVGKGHYITPRSRLEGCRFYSLD